MKIKTHIHISIYSACVGKICVNNHCCSCITPNNSPKIKCYSKTENCPENLFKILPCKRKNRKKHKIIVPQLIKQIQKHAHNTKGKVKKVIKPPTTVLKIHTHEESSPGLQQTTPALMGTSQLPAAAIISSKSIESSNTDVVRHHRQKSEESHPSSEILLKTSGDSKTSAPAPAPAVKPSQDNLESQAASEPLPSSSKYTELLPTVTMKQKENNFDKTRLHWLENNSAKGKVKSLPAPAVLRQDFTIKPKTMQKNKYSSRLHWTRTTAKQLRIRRL